MKRAPERLIIVGGANGVGKTTFARQYKEEYGINYLGADEIAEELSKSWAGNIELKAGKEFFRRLESILSSNASVIIESTLSGLLLAEQIKQFKSKGYTIEIVYVFLKDVELCKKRVRVRVKKGGHNVPEKEIERRYKRSMRNFQNIYLPLADKWQILYNGQIRPIEIAIGENRETMILDDEYFRLFKEIMKAKASKQKISAQTLREFADNRRIANKAVQKAIEENNAELMVKKFTSGVMELQTTAVQQLKIEIDALAEDVKLNLGLDNVQGLTIYNRLRRLSSV